MPGKKKFIDKKNAVSFHLVHRSQRDPLQADEDASQRVLLPKDKEKEARKEEERKYGVFFDDDYDYLKHLKDTDELDEEKDDSASWSLERDPEVESPVRQPEPMIQEVSDHDSKLKLSSRMFASTVETDVGLLNKAAPISGPKLDWDPEVVAGLDDDFDFDDPDNALEDDFMDMANAADGEDRDGERDSGDEHEFNSDTGSLDGADSMGEDPYMQEETKSRFTSYSMTSSVIKRNEGLTLLDDCFEQLYADYGEENVGALDMEEIAGGMGTNSDLISQLAEEFTIQTANIPTLAKTVDDDEVANVTAAVTHGNNSDDDEMIDKHLIVPADTTEKWDCESILSTYSNIYNRPKLIVEEKKKGRRKKQDQNEDDEEEEVEEDVRIVDPMCNYRPKDETPEEKQRRKKAIKEERQARRQDKKSNKIAFKKEQKRQEKEQLNLQHNMQKIKLT